MMSGAVFGMDGLSLDNTTWYNPKTGDVIKIRSNYFEDDHMVLQTMEGRMIRLESLQDYIQWQGPGQPPTKPMEDVPSTQPSGDLPPEVANLIGDATDAVDDGILPEDLELIRGNQPQQKRLKQDGFQPLNFTPQSKTTANYDIIKRALGKTKDPDWVLTMKWPKFPEKELDMLMTVMDIPMDEISEYYIGNIRNEFDEFISNLKSQLGDYITKKLNHEDATKEPKKPATTKGKSK